MKTDTAERLLEALAVEEAHINEYKGQLGFGATEIAECQQDRANLSVSLDNVDVSAATGKAITKVKNLVYSSPTPMAIEPYPTAAVTPLPNPSATAGALQRYNNRKQRAKLAPGYTVQIGLAMGYEDETPPKISPDLLTAALKSYKDSGNYALEAVFTKQGQSAMLFQYRLKGTEKWSDIKTALQSPVTINIPPPTPEGTALEIEIRVRLMNNNAQVGNWSPIYSLTLSS